MIAPTTTSAIPNTATLAAAGTALGPLARLATANRELAAEAQTTRPTAPANRPEASQDRESAAPQGREAELNLEQERTLRELQARDAAVRAHERAHTSAGGELVRGATAYQYTVGPDGRRYAVGGEVVLDTSAVADDPAATAEKAAQIRRAALAPADPSTQDQLVASQALAMELEARQQQRVERQADLQERNQTRAEQSETRRAQVERSFAPNMNDRGGLYDGFA